MATKKRTPRKEVVKPVEPVEETQALVEEQKKTPEICGHVNRHSYGVDRELDNITCDLPKGHDGDHSAMHDELQKTENVKIVDGTEVVSVTYETIQQRRGWTDMAGTPVSQITPGTVEQPSLEEVEKRVMELERNGKFHHPVNNG